MFGRRLVAMREHRGLTQAELAAAIGKRKPPYDEHLV